MSSLHVGRLLTDSKSPAPGPQVRGRVPGTSGKEGLILRDRIKTGHQGRAGWLPRGPDVEVYW